MSVYLFDIRLNCAIRVSANSEAEARAMLDTIDANTANLGAWPDGDPIIAEVSLLHEPREADLVEVDGVETDESATLTTRRAELESRVSTQSIALEAIAGMTIDDSTDHAQLSALMKAIAKQSVEGAI